MLPKNIKRKTSAKAKAKELKDTPKNNKRHFRILETFLRFVHFASHQELTQTRRTPQTTVSKAPNAVKMLNFTSTRVKKILGLAPTKIPETTRLYLLSRGFFELKPPLAVSDNQYFAQGLKIMLKNNLEQLRKTSRRNNTHQKRALERSCVLICKSQTLRRQKCPSVKNKGTKGFSKRINLSIL